MTRQGLLHAILTFVAIGVLSPWPPVHAQAPARPPVDFVRDVQPILTRSCYPCHGPKSQMGGLRLDARTLAMTGGQSGASIHPGKSGDSSLYLRVIGAGEQARMPMGGKPLPPEQVATLKAWIDEGAVWPEGVGSEKAEIKKHWAYVAPQRPALPGVQNAAWATQAIDRFVLARLEKEKLAPSPAADRTTLLRRVSLDLTGLPPTPAEVDAFLRDRSPKAYERQVDRLLDSPHYGEKWGRHWLDAARYADSDGYEKDKPRQAWFYRDWVIQALNRDLPYDRFIIEQLAGDLLPNATQEQRVATGFLRNSMINEEGGIDPEQFRVEALFDRVEAVGKAVLGVTVQCAQCHNHKFDPVTQEEYYRLLAYLNNAHEANLSVYSPEEQQKREHIRRDVAAIEADLQERHPDWATRMAAWEREAKSSQPAWTTVKPTVDDNSTGGQRYLPLPDGSLLAQGYAPTKHKVKITAKVDEPAITAFRLELLTDPNLPRNGPGRSVNGTAALTEFEVEAAPSDAPDKTVKVKFVRALADLDPPEAALEPLFDDRSGKRRVTGPVTFAIDGKDETAWGTDNGPALRNQPRVAVFVPETPVGFPQGTLLTFYLKQNHGGWNSDDNQSHNLGRMRLSLTTAAASAAPLPLGVAQALAVPSDQRTPQQRAALFSHWRTTVPEWQEANRRIAALWREHPEGTTQLALAERDEMRTTHMLSRGDFLKPGKAVEPGVPAFLHPLPKDAPPNRLGLARWLVDRQSPTTARAFVNRVWQTYFGQGLVATPEDLGKQSEAPSHPELLDWLAVEFMEQGWSQKALHRLIVASATYRQSSNVTPALLERDPYNRLLARGPRFRVEAESVRDIALAASGLLNAKVGGPSVHPPAPEFLFQPPASYSLKTWNESKGDERYRRALYTFRYRSIPYPMLQTFDAPAGDTACVRRPRSNTPLQALTTLNEPLFLEAARALALRALSDGGATDAERVAYAFRRVLARKPTPAESTELLAFLGKQSGRIREGWLNAPELAGYTPEDTKLPAGITPGRVAAWTALSRVLLNLDEAITKE